MTIKLFYRYSQLDKKHQYQIVAELSYFTQWVWFYLGRLTPEEWIFQIYSYEMTWDIQNKLLKEYKQTDARKVAWFILRRIIKHYKRRVRDRRIIKHYKR